MKEIVPFFEEIFDINKTQYKVGTKIENQEILVINKSKVVIGNSNKSIKGSYFEINSQEVIDQLVELYYSLKIDKIIFDNGFRVSKFKNGNFYNITIGSDHKDSSIEEMNCVENLTIDNVSVINTNLKIWGDPLDWSGKNPHNNCKMNFKNVKINNLNVYAHNTYKDYNGLFFPCDNRCKFNLNILSIQTSHKLYDELTEVNDPNQFMANAKHVLKIGKNINFQKFILTDCEEGYAGSGIHYKLSGNNWIPFSI